MTNDASTVTKGITKLVAKSRGGTAAEAAGAPAERRQKTQEALRGRRLRPAVHDEAAVSLPRVSNFNSVAELQESRIS